MAIDETKEELTDSEFACLLFRSCGVSITSGVFGADISLHTSSCRFCLGVFHVTR